jgi:hypothetical protein
LQLHASISPLDQKNAWFQVQFLKMCNFFKVEVRELLDLPWEDTMWKQHCVNMYFSNFYAGLSLPTSESSAFTLKYWAYGMTLYLWVHGCELLKPIMASCILFFCLFGSVRC